jgi:hypothetical protein
MIMKLWKIELPTSNLHDIEKAIVLAESADQAYELMVESLRAPWTPPGLPPGVYKQDTYFITEVSMTASDVLMVVEDHY